MMSQKLVLVPLAVVSNLVLLYITLQFAPEDGGGGRLSFPSSLEDIRELSVLLNNYSKNNPTYVLVLFSMAYLFKQTFAVPGSVFLNVLSGAIFGPGLGFLLCSSLTAVGASLCYLLARAVGKDAALKYFPERVQTFGYKLEENKQELPFFLLFLRLFPMSPNWALNMASGVLGNIRSARTSLTLIQPLSLTPGVPLHLFFFSVFFGLMPYNYLCVTSGVILSEIKTVRDHHGTWMSPDNDDNI